MQIVIAPEITKAKEERKKINRFVSFLEDMLLKGLHINKKENTE